MADQKIFAGPRIRRLRKAEGLTQSSMAEGLGISASYLNLIERNQRPLTVQLILKLSSAYGIEPDDLQDGPGGVISVLREAFSDPLLSGEVSGDQELIEAAELVPNVAASIGKLYRAYQEQAERLSDLSDLLSKAGHQTEISASRQPIDEVHEIFETRPNFFSKIEEEAESFWRLLEPGDDLEGALINWLKSEYGIRVQRFPAADMPNWRRRYDRHSQRLFVSERLSPFDQLREIAMEACLIRMRVAVASELEKFELGSDEATRYARFELARYAALAVMMPYDAYHAAAVRANYDVDVLRSRFNVSFEQAANRLTMLSRQSAQGVPFFMLEVDNAGNIFRRAGANGFPRQRFGGSCPKLPIHAAFVQPGQILVEAIEMPDGAEFLVIARTLEGPQGAFTERPRRTALMLGCDIGFKNEIIYGTALPGPPPGRSAKEAHAPSTPVGPACRLCERAGCLARAEPPVTKPLGLDERGTGLSAFDFL